MAKEPIDLSRPPCPGGKALEMLMRDVLAGMEELAHIAAFEPRPCELRIVSVQAPATAGTARARIIPHPALGCRPDTGPTPADATDHLMRRERAARG